MAVTDPYPGQPTDGQALDAVPILAKFNALFEGIEAFDGSQINAGSVAASALASNINPNTLLHDTIQPFVESGCIWTQTSGLIGTMSSGVIYAGTSSAIYRVSVSGIGSYTFTASKDTYIDIDYNGNIYYGAVTNNGTAPTMTANAIRIAKVVTGASAISSVVQAGVDNINTTGVLDYIYNTNPNAQPLYTIANTGTAGGTFFYQNTAGHKEFYGYTNSLSVNSTFTVVFPSSFYSVAPSYISLTNVGSAANVMTSYVVTGTVAVTGFSLYNNTNSSDAQPIYINVKGI